MQQSNENMALKIVRRVEREGERGAEGEGLPE